MYAVVKIKNQQFKVEPKARISVPLLDNEVGATVTFDEVLIVGDGEEVTVGAPTIDGCSVSAEVVRHGLERKVVVFKKKRRKNYRRKKGHRQHFTEILIKEIVSN
ncbi:MAG: 50S ribosomal protein L21 [bacterium]